MNSETLRDGGENTMALIVYTWHVNSYIRTCLLAYLLSHLKHIMGCWSGSPIQKPLEKQISTLKTHQFMNDCC